MKRFDRVFEMTDGVTTRKACFKKPSARDGLKMVSIFSDGKMDENQAEALAELAAKHLVLLSGGDIKQEQEIQSFDELCYVFDDPFIGLTLIKEFQEDISPLLRRSAQRLPGLNEEISR